MHIPSHELSSLITYWTLAKLNLAHLHNLTPHQLIALGFIVAQGLVPFKELRQVLALPMSSFTFLVDKLEKRKLVKRERAIYDRRQWLLKATKKGNKLASDIREEESNILQSLANQAPSYSMETAGKILSKNPQLIGDS